MAESWGENHDMGAGNFAGLRYYGPVARNIVHGWLLIWRYLCDKFMERSQKPIKQLQPLQATPTQSWRNPDTLHGSSSNANQKMSFISLHTFSGSKNLSALVFSKNSIGWSHRTKKEHKPSLIPGLRWIKNKHSLVVISLGFLSLSPLGKCPTTISEERWRGTLEFKPTHVWPGTQLDWWRTDISRRPGSD